MSKFCVKISLILLLGILYSNPVSAQICRCGFDDGQFTLVNTTMDGNMNEWDTVTNDIDNNVCDGTGQGEDRDYPVQSTGRDLRQFSFTWDDTYLSAYTRRYASSSNKNNFIYYADTNTDGLMSDGEPVIVVLWSGSSRNVEVFVGSYEAVDPIGDPLVDDDGFADGYTLPGSLSGNIQGKGQYGGTWGSSTGTAMEWQVKWSDLGVPAGTAISWHVSTTNAQPGSGNISNQIDDNLGGCGGGIGGTQYADISFTQSTNDSLLTGSTVYLPHEVTNNGNIQDTLDFELTSSGDFSVSSVQYYQDLGTVGTYESGTDILLTDTDGDGFPDTGNMDPGESKSILIKVVLPSAPAAGTAILTTEATSNFIPASDPAARITDTVQDTLTLLHKVEGTVFEDITGDALDDGDNTLNDGNGDQQGRANVRVLLFRDGGDGVPDGSDDTFVESTTTNTVGEYSFSAVSDTYWIVADSRSAGLSNGTTWPEQTYAAAGAICSDGAGGSSTKTGAGPCFGGRRGDQSDNLPASTDGTDVANAEHLIEVELVQSGSADNNFGFSYNVVTNVRDGDDDGAAARSTQGSLRQFIQNANAIIGANAMRFVPAVPLNQGNWWRVTPISQLPTISNASTTIDGTAYQLGDGVTVRVTNSGTTGNGSAPVGVGPDGVAGTGDESTLPTYELPELEINGNDLGRIFQVGAGNTILRRLGMFNIQNSTAVTVTAGTGSEIRENLIGPLADGTDPGSGNRVYQGVDVNGGAADVLENRVAYLRGNGISVSNTAIVSDNDIFVAGSASLNFDGISVEGSNGQTISVVRNRIENIAAYGIESRQAPGPFTIENNTIRNTGVGGGEENGGIRIFGDGSTVRYNFVSGAAGPGIVVVQNTGSGQASTGNLISMNSTFSNGEIGIDLDQTTNSGNPNGDGVTPNNGTTNNTLQNIDQDYPVFTKVSLDGNTLRVEGYVGTGASPITGPHIVELFIAEDDGNNNGEVEAGDGRNVPHGEGRTYVQSFTTNPDGTFSADLAVSGINPGNFITATATDVSNSTSEFSANAEVELAGVSVEGTVYSDANRDGVFDSGENGLQGVTVVLYDSGEGSCQSVQTDVNGDYLFQGVDNGNYQVIESAGESTPAPGSCSPAEADPDGYVSITPNTLSISVSGGPVTEKNFGDFNGSRLSGTVFRDDGSGGGTANDGTQNGEEPGIDKTTIKLQSSDGTTVHDEVITSGDGSYTLWIPDALTGTTLRVAETNFGSYLSTGGNAGTTGGSYDRAADATVFTPASGAEYTGVKFADVPENSFNTDGQQNTTAGTTVFFPHTFVPRSDGEVSFSAAKEANPANSGWTQTIFRDNNCNGEIDSGDADVLNPIVATKAIDICIVVRVNTPNGAPEGASNTITITADFNYTNALPTLSKSYARTDLIKITDASGSGLKIVKQVDRQEALPGETLAYTISYTNNSSEPINNLEIDDSTPAYTYFSSAACGTLSNNLSNCAITEPAPGTAGVIKWTFTGTLAPGASGEVTYTVTIKN